MRPEDMPGPAIALPGELGGEPPIALNRLRQMQSGQIQTGFSASNIQRMIDQQNSKGSGLSNSQWNGIGCACTARIHA